jgi:hypothetical protein
MNLPSRYDLKSFSCVNQEVNIFNRKLGKVMKIFDHVYQCHMVFDNYLHTRHGLHLNKKGKKSVAKQLASMIRGILVDSEKVVAPIPMQWIDHEKVAQPKIIETSRKEEDEEEEIEHIQQREQTQNKRDDFLCNMKHEFPTDVLMLEFHGDRPAQDE